MLSVSIVTYESDLDVLNNLLTSLVKANTKLAERDAINELLIIDNTIDPLPIAKYCKKTLDKFGLSSVVHNGYNVGYGKAHNRAIENINSEFHLILNPDVSLEVDALRNGIEFLNSNPEVVAVSPYATDQYKSELFLAKRYPSLLVLFLRGLNVKWLVNLSSKQIEEYEYQKEQSCNDIFSAQLISGCFMLCRTEALKKVGGFDDKYFLYFEDFALSMKLGMVGKLMFLKSMEIQHYGGDASRKGIKHIFYFICSAYKFYRDYGWKLI